MSTVLTPTLPAAVYLSDDVWAVERERIWFRQWVAVARVDDLVSVGDHILADLAGESVIVVRAGDGLHAFYNVGQHRGAELVDRQARRAGRPGP